MHYVKYCTRAWVRRKISTRQSAIYILETTPECKISQSALWKTTFQKNSAEQIISPSLLCPWKWDFEYEYNTDFLHLGMGNTISDGDNDDLLFGKENEPPSERREQ